MAGWQAVIAGYGQERAKYEEGGLHRKARVRNT